MFYNHALLLSFPVVLCHKAYKVSACLLTNWLGPSRIGFADYSERPDSGRTASLSADYRWALYWLQWMTAFTFNTAGVRTVLRRFNLSVLPAWHCYWLQWMFADWHRQSSGVLRIPLSVTDYSERCSAELSSPRWSSGMLLYWLQWMLCWIQWMIAEIWRNALPLYCL